MTNEEITNYKTQVEEIVKKKTESLIGELESIASEIGAPTAPGGGGRERLQNLVNNIHIKLQTETMLNACVSAKESGELAKQSCSLAKWSCFWAAIAAVAACISIVVMLCLK